MLLKYFIGFFFLILTMFEMGKAKSILPPKQMRPEDISNSLTATQAEKAEAGSEPRPAPHALAFILHFSLLCGASLSTVEDGGRRPGLALRSSLAFGVFKLWASVSSSDSRSPPCAQQQQEIVAPGPGPAPVASHLAVSGDD